MSEMCEYLYTYPVYIFLFWNNTRKTCMDIIAHSGIDNFTLCCSVQFVSLDVSALMLLREQQICCVGVWACCPVPPLRVRLASSFSVSVHELLAFTCVEFCGSAFLPLNSGTSTTVLNLVEVRSFFFFFYFFIPNGPLVLPLSAVFVS